MNRILLATLVAAALAACKIGGSETTTGAGPSCTASNGACLENANCCSYACASGVCIPNSVEGGACRTTNDCAAPRLCKSGGCTTPTGAMCRDNADVCSSWAQCCSGDCVGGSCTQNHSPVANAGPDVNDAPYTVLYTLQNLTAPDPDADPVFFGWTFTDWPGRVAGVPAPALSSSTARTPTFTPMVTGTYQLHLVATDGPVGAPNRLSTSDDVTIAVVNRAPVVTNLAATDTTPSRNVPITLAATVSDPDGDTLECSWRQTPPGAAAPTMLVDFAPCANPSNLTLPFTATGEGPYLLELVVRDHDRTTNAVVNTTVAGITLTSHNDPPTIVVSRSPYYGNMGPTVAQTPAIQLDASGSTDPNGDHLAPPAPPPGLSYFWEVLSAADGGSLPPLTGADTATPTFVPDRATDFVVRVTVTDQPQFGRAGDSNTLDITVRVGRYIQQLGHDVVDAAFAKTTDRLWTAGHDPADATKGMIWSYNPADGTEAAGIRLVDPVDATASGIPKLLGVTPDGTRAVVVDQGVSIWIVNLGTGAMTRSTQPFAVGSMVVAGNRYAYLFKSTGDDYVRELDLTGGSMVPKWSGYGGYGAAYSVASTTYIYRVDTFFDDWDKYSVPTTGNSGASTTPLASQYGAPSCGGYPAIPATAIWASQNNQYVFSSCGKVYSATTLADLPQTLGLSPAHMDSVSTGPILAVDSGGQDIALFTSTLQANGMDVLPRWAQDGYGRTASAKRAFFNALASKRIAVVSDTATPTRYGIITFP